MLDMSYVAVAAIGVIYHLLCWENRLWGAAVYSWPRPIVGRVILLTACSVRLLSSQGGSGSFLHRPGRKRAAWQDQTQAATKQRAKDAVRGAANCDFRSQSCLSRTKEQEMVLHTILKRMPGGQSTKVGCSCPCATPLTFACFLGGRWLCFYYVNCSIPTHAEENKEGARLLLLGETCRTWCSNWSG